MFLHIDIDSFFISAERAYNNRLLNIPAGVGSRSNLEIFNKNRSNIKLLNINSGAFVTPIFYNDFQKNFENYFVDKINNKKKIRGIITTASYEARECGVKTGMPIAKALTLCPNMVILPPNYTLYHKLSKKLYIELKRKIPIIEQYSIDEFFGQLDGWIEDKDSFSFAKELQEDIFNTLRLPVSIGVAKSKYIAKVATNFAKPNGVYIVKNKDEFIKNIPIEDFPGIGKNLTKKLHFYGIKSLGDICNSKELLYRWKLPGIELFNRVCLDGGEIKQKEPKKSIGLSRTFDAIYEYKEIKRRIVIMARYITYMVKRANVNPLRYELKINFEDGYRVKKGVSINRVFSEHLLKETLVDILNDIWPKNRGAIKLRVSVYNFHKKSKNTLSLLHYQEDLKQKELDNAVTKLRGRFGLDILKNANEL